MATKCDLEGCEEKAKTDSGGKIPLTQTIGVFGYTPARVVDPTGQQRKTFRGGLYFCSVSHLADYLFQMGVISHEERTVKRDRASDDSPRTHRELARLEYKRKKEREEGRGPERRVEGLVEDFEIDI